MRYDVLTIAGAFLRFAAQHNKSPSLQELMQLCFIAYSQTIDDGEPLFSARIEAWLHGPGIPDVYNRLVNRPRDKHDTLAIQTLLDTPVDAETAKILNDIYTKYGQRGGPALSQLTKRHGTPWHVVHEPNAYGKHIPDRIIRKHRQALLGKSRFKSGVTENARWRPIPDSSTRID